MTKQSRALQMAINALTNCSRFEEAIQACKEALEYSSWQGLSDDEMIFIAKNNWDENDFMVFGCAIEQALKEKNNGTT